MNLTPPGQKGFSLVEAMFAVALTAAFFVSLFALNTQCLYFTNASRELMTAGQTGQTRVEQVRKLSLAQVTDANYLKNNVLNAAVAGSTDLGPVTETLTVNSYPTPASTPITIRRDNGVATIVSTNAAIAAAEMATVNFEFSWKASPGSRGRKIAFSTLCVQPVR